MFKFYILINLFTFFLFKGKIPESGKLSKEERVLLQRNQSQLIQNPVPHTQHHRRRRCRRHFRRPLTTPLHCLPSTFCRHLPILHRVGARPRLLLPPSGCKCQPRAASHGGSRRHQPHWPRGAVTVTQPNYPGGAPQLSLTDRRGSAGDG